MQDLLNVVVGAGIPGYFENCLASVDRLNQHDTLAIYNYQDKKDATKAKTIASNCDSKKVTFILRQNEQKARTGSLYDAYNEAIDFALFRYRYISFIQADMQMMWWDDQIIARCDEAMSNTNSASGSKLCFYTQLPVRGKRLDYYAIWRDESGASTRLIPGAVDVGLYPLAEIFGDGFRFTGSEREFSDASAQRGVNTILHPFPFLAPIPFPQTIRSRNRGLARKNLPGVPGQILKIAQDAFDTGDFSQDSFHPFWMEDVVDPDGWDCLTPYWPSDTSGTEWFRIRWLLANETKMPLCSLKVGKQRRGLMTPFEPGLWPLVRSGARFFMRELGLKVRRRTGANRKRTQTENTPETK